MLLWKQLATSMAKPLTRFLHENKEWLISWALVILTVTLVIKFWPQGPSPVPQTIRSEASFKIIYPNGYSIDQKSWKYINNTQTVQFIAKKDAYTVVFTEQPTPLAYQNDQGAYDRFIGSLRPNANFNVPLGTVSLSNFVTSGDFQVVGVTGILKVKDTLLLAHPDTQLTDDQWRSLFESLKVD